MLQRRIIRRQTVEDDGNGWNLPQQVFQVFAGVILKKARIQYQQVQRVMMDNPISQLLNGFHRENLVALS